MREVTHIEKLTKNKVRVEFDEELRFILPAYELSALSLEIGSIFEDDAFEQLYEEHVLKKAKQKVMGLLERRDYTKKELQDKLMQAGFPADAVSGAIAYVESYHYIDDDRYTRNFLEYRSSGKSRQMVYQTLAQKGIDTEKIREYMEDADMDDEAGIRRIYRQKFSDNMDFSREKKQKIFNYFLRKGYKYNDIANVLKDFDRI